MSISIVGARPLPSVLGPGSTSEIDPSPIDSATLRIEPWPDPVIDSLGYDPRSWYVEQFWLPVIGPTSTWLVRHLAARLDASPAGIDIEVDATAHALGLGRKSGRHSPLQRSLSRCVTFELACRRDEGTYRVRRRIPPLPRRHLVRLPLSLQETHRVWTNPPSRPGTIEQMRRRARRLALGLFETGMARSAAEVELVRWRTHPSLAHEAARWAWSLDDRVDGA